jgi:hypothetical protein
MNYLSIAKSLSHAIAALLPATLCASSYACRLAMIAIIAFWVQELVSNQGILEQLNNHGSITPNQL